VRALPSAGAVLLLASALSLSSLRPAPAAAEEGLPEYLAPIHAARLAHEGRATFRHSPSDLGAPELAFDGKAGTVLRTAGVNPAFLEVAFDAPREVLTAEALFPGGDPHDWSLLAGDDPDRLRVVFAERRVEPEAWSRVERFTPPLRARVFRVVAKRLGGGDSVRFGEIALQARQRPVSLEVAAPSSVACPDGDLVVRARVAWDGGHRSDAAPGLWFDVPRDAAVSEEPVPPTGPPVARLRYRQAGRVEVRVRLRGRERGLSSPPFVVEARSEGRPDWCVAVLERTPRLDFDGPGGGVPAIGASVLWRARVRNYGTAAAPRVFCRWEVDGNGAGEAWLEGIERFGEEVAELRLPRDGARHEVRFVVDPADAVPETSEGNNSRSVASDALLLGLWVERPVLDRFHRVQSALGDGANSFEDWAQRQVAAWNGMLEQAVFPLTPEGCTDRVALDRVLVVEEGGLPLAGGLPSNDPDARDRTVDLQWGFPATLVEGGAYDRPADREPGNPLWIDRELLRALSRARYLADAGRLSVRRDEVLLEAPDGRPLAGSPWLGEPAPGLVHRSSACALMAGERTGGYGEHSAWALERIARVRARGGNRAPPPVQGEYLGDLPEVVGIRVVDGHGRPLDGIEVRAWRRAPGGDGRGAFAGEPVRSGTTSDGGALELSLRGADPFFEGRRDPPLDPGQGVLLLRLSRGGVHSFRFLEVVPFNLAAGRGRRDAHFEEIRLDLPR
jgi:hypothetical protein